jgi:thiol-disulfide isomerase/thioredoxin
MKRILSLLAIAAPIFLFSATQTHAQTANSVMQKVAKKLAAVKALGYTHTREFNYPSEDYLSKSISTGYLDMSAPDTANGFRFHFSDDEYISVYNGSESFVAVKKKKIMVVNNNPPRNMLESSSYLYNSPLTLKHVLPKIIADSKIPKKLTAETIGGQRRYLVEFTLTKTTIGGLGDIHELRDERVSVYRVAIDAKTFLPIEVLVTNNKNKDFTKTTFADVTENPAPPTDLSWYFSTYTDQYKVQQPENKKLLEVGKVPPAFALRELDSGSEISLEKYKGKVVLIEFWIVQCGFCIAAVPKLNELAKAFQNVEFVAINVHDQPETIASFKNRNKPVYTILIEGEATGDAYGVGGYPAIVLIGKDGTIAYTSMGVFEKELESAIEASLAK